MFKRKGRYFLLAPYNGTLRFRSTSLSRSAPEALPPPHEHGATLLDPRTHLQYEDTNFFVPKFWVLSLLNCKGISTIRQVHTLIAVTGMLHNLYVVNKLLHVYSYHRALGDAYALFGVMTERDPKSWSVMVGGFAKVGDSFKCHGTFRELIRSGAQPDNYRLPMITRACRDTSDLQMGRAVQSVAWKNGLNLDRFVCAALVEMYAECGVIEDARKLFTEMPDKDLVTWTVMIGVLAESGDADESLELFDRMRRGGIVPDEVAMVNVVHACAKFGALHKAREVHNYIRMNSMLEI